MIGRPLRWPISSAAQELLLSSEIASGSAGKHVKVLLAIARCRTAALGGHVDQCTSCGHRATISYNSCRNRHCPKCQTAARDRWIAARQKELLPTRYVHVVFTLPASLAPLTLQNKKFIYGLLLRASAETLSRSLVIPTPRRGNWFLQRAAHLEPKARSAPSCPLRHPAGGLSLDHTHWIKSRSRFFLSIRVLRRVFRGKFVVGLKQAFQSGRLSFRGNLAASLSQNLRCLATVTVRKDWWSTRNLPRWPDMCSSIGPLHPSRAISTIVCLVTEGKVTFRWRDSAHNNQQNS